MVRLPDKGVEGQHDEAPGLAELVHEVKELVRLITATDVSELHLESGQMRIVIKRGVQPSAGVMPSHSVYTPPATLPALETSSPVHLIGHSPAHGDDIVVEEGEQIIVSPMVGTFYSSPAPNEETFVSVGDIVEPGQTVGIIEAMKMMNEIEAEVAGRISRILVQNAQPVEYGQPLMVVSAEL
ncbi:MAG: acetyl-CoA carboxylase biotin carboxyl carrier protein [Chloroflexota bacterium]|nr:acetyl-CoA carboxylase biotin carboxyl carrier protein [Chloroflexota bacterium]